MKPISLRLDNKLFQPKKSVVNIAEDQIRILLEKAGNKDRNDQIGLVK